MIDSMFTENALISHFEADVQEKSRWLRALIALDQLGNVLLWNGSSDETISSHIGRRIEDGSATKFDRVLCSLLRKLESYHCLKSRGE